MCLINGSHNRWSGRGEESGEMRVYIYDVVDDKRKEKASNKAVSRRNEGPI